MSQNKKKNYQQDEIKYHMLRSQLDKLQYLQTLGYDSLDLIEALLNDILTLKRKEQSAQFLITSLSEKNNDLLLGIEAYKYQNKELYKQNSELHNEIVTLLEKQSYKGKDLELKRLNEDSNSIKFLLNTQKEKNRTLQNEIVQLKQKYVELIVNIYDKRKSLHKIFQDLPEDELILFKPKEIDEVIESNNRTLINSNLNMNMNMNNNIDSIQPGISNSNGFNYSGTQTLSPGNTNNINELLNNNRTTINVNQADGFNNINVNTNFSNSAGYSRVRNANKEMMERIYQLESEIKEKNKEIEILKRNISIENTVEHKVIIDYLKKELDNTKEKYELYLKYQMDKNQKLKNKKMKIDNNYTKNEVDKKSKRSKYEESLFEKENMVYKSKYEALLKENEILKQDMNQVVENYNNSNKFIQDQLEAEFTDFSRQNVQSQNAEINLITSLSQKLQEANANLNSTKQNYIDQLNELTKVNKILTDENKKLVDNSNNQNKLVSKFKEEIESLKQQIFQLKCTSDIGEDSFNSQSFNLNYQKKKMTGKKTNNKVMKNQSSEREVKTGE